MLERDPQLLEELTRFGDQHYAAHPTSRVQKETPLPFNAFACEGSAEMSDDEVDPYAAQKFPKEKPQHHGRSWEKRSHPQFRSTSEQRPTHYEQPHPPERSFRDFKKYKTVPFMWLLETRRIILSILEEA